MDIEAQKADLMAFLLQTFPLQSMKQCLCGLLKHIYQKANKKATSQLSPC